MPAGSALAALLLLGSSFGAWSHVLSPDAFFSVNPRVAYSDVKKDPTRHKGTILMLAGVIAENVTSREGTTLEIVCYARDEADRPEEPDDDCGRFLAKTSHILDPEQYARGRKVTLTGKTVGQTVLTLGQGEQQRVTFDIGEIYLWPRPPERLRHSDLCDPFWDPWRDPFYRHRWRHCR